MVFEGILILSLYHFLLCCCKVADSGAPPVILYVRQYHTKNWSHIQQVPGEEMTIVSCTKNTERMQGNQDLKY